MARENDEAQTRRMVWEEAKAAVRAHARHPDKATEQRVKAAVSELRHLPTRSFALRSEREHNS